ncbi:MAG: porin [Nitrospira sp.]|nr:porin [Nitrospira sp.]
MAAATVAAQEPPDAPPSQPPSASSATEATTDSSLWHYGAYLDLSYDLNFNFPSNHLFRSRTTAVRTNELDPNMALAYLRKDATSDSRWGMEFGVQGGYDSTEFAFLQGEPRVNGYDTLRHFSRANVSYLAPVNGKDLTVTAGLFNSLIGYESLYAKDNFNYTRSWIADNTPYMMFGVNARYAVNERFTATAFVINSYYHLAHPNDQPSYGTQLAWKATPRLTMTQTVYYGPDQANTSMEFWRLYSNHITEWKSDEVTMALAYDFGTENLAGQPGSPRAFVMGGALFARWHVAGPWSVAVRPEFYWDRNGRWTGNQQLVKAITNTLEYKIPSGWTNTTLRMEYRYDDSTGKQGGFFKGGETRPGVIGLTPGQHLMIFGLLWTFDSP